MGISDLAFAATLRVPADYATIQSCIDAAVSGQDECVVAPGTYNELINFLGKAITLRSSEGPEVTTIDGTGLNGSVVVCRSGETDRTVLVGFRIANSSLINIQPYSAAGGMWVDNSDPTIMDCHFFHNSAQFGGGLALIGSSPKIRNCKFEENEANNGGAIAIGANSTPTIQDVTFVRNKAHERGGGIYNLGRNPTVTNCTFNENTAEYGGGMYNSNSSPTVNRCAFIRNTADLGGGMLNGGMFDNPSSPTVTNCIFERNVSDSVGGGMFNIDSSPTVTSCIFTGNSARYAGGGMRNDIQGDATVKNCTFSGNFAYFYGGGMQNEQCNPKIVNCTFSGNKALGGGAMDNYYGASPIVSNCILWGNNPDEITLDSAATLRSSNVQGGLPSEAIDGGGNIDIDPIFVREPNGGDDGFGDDPFSLDIDESLNDDYGDLRLQSGSPCINSGDPDFVPASGETDLDSHARVLCGRVDMGAYEFGIGDYDCNQIVDLVDVADWELCQTGPNTLRSAARSGAGFAGSTVTTGSASLHPWLPTLAPAGATGCEAFDFNADGDIDLADFANLQNAFTGPDFCPGGICVECLHDSDCDDAEICTSDTCEKNNTCLHTAIAGCCNVDADCDEGLSCTADTCQANHTCAHTLIPGCIKHTFATFTDPLSGFATQEVRDVNNEIVKFDPVRKSIVYVATGAEYQVGSWPVSGNVLGFGGYFQVRFGTVLGEHRAFFTETGSATICDFVVTPTSFLIYSTNTPVPHT